MGTSAGPVSLSPKISTDSVNTADPTVCRDDSIPSQKSKSEVYRSKNHEAVATLLASFGQDAEECSENFAKQEISFKDLASLTKEDLILLGITDLDKQEEILETFRELPKQNLSHENIVNSGDAQTFNKQILHKAASHMDTMKTAISATNLKLKVRPSGDVIMEEKNFASKFVLEALDELKKITEEIEDRLSVLEEMTSGKAVGRGLKLYETAVIAGLAFASFAVWYWRFR